MANVFARNMIGMTVVGSQGKIIGTVSEILADTHKGEILHFLVSPENGIEIDEIKMKKDERGSFLLSVDQIQAVRDDVVIKL